LLRSDIDRSTLDVVVSSTGCGWRKPDPRAFESFASRLDISVETVTHVGDDPTTDGGIEAVGGRVLLLDEHSLADIPSLLDSDGRPDEVE